MAFAAVLISFSTMAVKQHSFIDVMAAIPVGLLAEILVFHKYWKKKLQKV